MSNWTFTSEDVANSPSVRAGLPLFVEKRYRREAVQFIFYMKARMGLSLQAVSTAALYFHRFYMYKTFQEFERFPAAVACLLFAGKVEETPKRVRDLLFCTWEILPDHMYAQFDKGTKEALDQVIAMEKQIVKTMKFQMEFKHPTSFIGEYTGILKLEETILQKLRSKAYALGFASWCSTLCLEWDSEVIAVAAIYMACKDLKIAIQDWEGKEPKHAFWWDCYMEGLTTGMLDEMLFAIQLYENAIPTTYPPVSPNSAHFSAPPFTNPWQTKTSRRRSHSRH